MCLIVDGGSYDDLLSVNNDFLEKSLWKLIENLEDDGFKDMKCKDLKVSKFVKKVWKYV